MRQLFEALYRNARDAGDKVAVSDSGRVPRRDKQLIEVTGLAADLRTKAGTIGILAPNGVDWMIAQLACALAGMIAVPLPTFFSSAQLGHVVRNASIELILITNQVSASPEFVAQKIPYLAFGILRDPYRTPFLHVSDDLCHRIFGRHRN
jgi:acyl-CoA synthetase (AMP-forming)/AMP-acid ligase II